MSSSPAAPTEFYELELTTSSQRGRKTTCTKGDWGSLPTKRDEAENSPSLPDRGQGTGGKISARAWCRAFLQVRVGELAWKKNRTS